MQHHVPHGLEVPVHIPELFVLPPTVRRNGLNLGSASIRRLFELLGDEESGTMLLLREDLAGGVDITFDIRALDFDLFALLFASGFHLPVLQTGCDGAEHRSGFRGGLSAG